MYLRHNVSIIILCSFYLLFKIRAYSVFFIVITYVFSSKLPHSFLFCSFRDETRDGDLLTFLLCVTDIYCYVFITPYCVHVAFFIVFINSSLMLFLSRLDMKCLIRTLLFNHYIYVYIWNKFNKCYFKKSCSGQPNKAYVLQLYIVFFLSFFLHFCSRVWMFSILKKAVI